MDVRYVSSQWKRRTIRLGNMKIWPYPHYGRGISNWLDKLTETSVTVVEKLVTYMWKFDHGQLLVRLRTDSIGKQIFFAIEFNQQQLKCLTLNELLLTNFFWGSCKYFFWTRQVWDRFWTGLEQVFAGWDHSSSLHTTLVLQVFVEFQTNILEAMLDL